MATLAQLRAKLNLDLAVSDDANDPVWSQAARSAAIADAYAELWRVGVWKFVTEDLATVSDQVVYDLASTMRRLDRIELIDSDDAVLDLTTGIVEEDGAGTWQLRLTASVRTGYTLRVRGWAAYVSTFASDSASDDLPAEHNRVPLLKAKVILYRQVMSQFARYGIRETMPPEMNLSMESLFGMVAAAEREFADSAKRLSDLRPRSTQIRRL